MDSSLRSTQLRVMSDLIKGWRLLERRKEPAIKTGAVIWSSASVFVDARGRGVFVTSLFSLLPKRRRLCALSVSNWSPEIRIDLLARKGGTGEMDKSCVPEIR